MVGVYEVGGMKIEIHKKNDSSDSYKRANIIDNIMNDGLFEFL